MKYSSNKSNDAYEKLQAQFLSACKLADLGRISATISHEIKNYLFIIKGNAELLLKSPKTFEKQNDLAQRKLSQIICSVDRVNLIIDTIKTLSRDGSRDPLTRVPVKKLIDTATEYAQAFFKQSSVPILIGSFSPDLQIECREVLISQTLINLIQNAHDAIEDSKSDRWIKLDVCDLNDHIQISVTDSGLGIPPHIQEKINSFSFFTTKEPGKGTGLGLFTSRRFIEDHGGTFFLDQNSPNTRFVIQLPKHLIHLLG